MFMKAPSVNKHRLLINILGSVGLAVDSGYCYGYSMMAAQAVLLRDTPAFDRRMSVLLSLPEEELKKAMSEAFSRPAVDNGNKARQQFYIDMQAFLSGISLYQNISRYAFLFNKSKVPLKQDYRLTSSVILPQQLVDEGGLTSSRAFYGIYQQYDIFNMLQSLRMQLRNSKINFPAAFFINSSNHVLTLGFDPEYNGWLYMEVHSGVTQVLGDMDAARKIHEIFTDNNHASLSANVFTTARHVNELNEAINQWRLSDEFREAHAMSMRRIQAEDSYHTNLLYVIIENNDVHRLTNILKSSHVNINLLTKDGLSPLQFACLLGHVDCVRLLLRDIRTDVNIQTVNDGMTPLQIALSQQKIEVIKELLRHPRINVNLQRKDGFTPLHLATYLHYTDIVKLLLSHKNIDVNLKYHDDLTALHLATMSNNLEGAIALLNHPGLDVEALTKKGATALMLAAAQNNLRIAKYITVKFPDTIDTAIDGLDAIQVANYNKHWKMVSLLNSCKSSIHAAHPVR